MLDDKALFNLKGPFPCNVNLHLKIHKHYEKNVYPFFFLVLIFTIQLGWH